MWYCAFIWQKAYFGGYCQSNVYVCICLFLLLLLLYWSSCFSSVFPLPNILLIFFFDLCNFLALSVFFIFVSCFFCLLVFEFQIWVGTKGGFVLVKWGIGTWHLNQDSPAQVRTVGIYDWHAQHNYCHLQQFAISSDMNSCTLLLIQCPSAVDLPGERAYLDSLLAALAGCFVHL